METGTNIQSKAGQVSFQDSRADAAGNIRVTRYSSIEQVDEGVWDSLNEPIDLFHTHRFIRSVEAGREEGVKMWHLLCTQGGKPLGSASLFSYTVSLEMFLEGWMQRIVRTLRKLFPSLMSIRVLFCGLPISIGKNAVALAHRSDHQMVLGLLLAEMKEVAADHGLRFICVKECVGVFTTLDAFLSTEGFIKASSLPYAHLAITWATPEEYLSALRHPYRRAIRRSLAKLDRSGLRIVSTNGTVCSPSTFYRLYCEVMKRTTVKLETLPAAFFDSFYEEMRNELDIVCVVLESRVVGAALCTVSGGTMTFLLAGLDYESRDHWDVYHNLLFGVTARSIERGCARLDLGQTSVRAKARLGGTTTPAYFYLRASNRSVHRLLRWSSGILFPGETIPERHVFRRD